MHTVVVLGHAADLLETNENAMTLCKLSRQNVSTLYVNHSNMMRFLCWLNKEKDGVLVLNDFEDFKLLVSVGIPFHISIQKYTNAGVHSVHVQDTVSCEPTYQYSW